MFLNFFQHLFFNYWSVVTKYLLSSIICTSFIKYVFGWGEGVQKRLSCVWERRTSKFPAFYTNSLDWSYLCYFIANIFERLSLNKPMHSFNPHIQEDNSRGATLKESKNHLYLSKNNFLLIHLRKWTILICGMFF